MKTTRRILFLLMAVSLLSALLPGVLPTASATICETHVRTQQVTQEPTCVDYGYYIGVCAICGTPMDNGGTIPPLGHDFHDDWETMYPAACTEPGMQIRFCHRCQQEEIRETPPLGHNWTEQTVYGKEATCTEDGFREYVRVCTRCGAYDDSLPITGVEGYRVDIPALGHDWGEWKEEYPGDCVEQGMNVRKCKRCGYEQYVYSGYGDHDWGDWQVVTPAAPGKAGLERRVCKINAAHVEEREIPALPVNPGLMLTWKDDIFESADGKTAYHTTENNVYEAGDILSAAVDYFNTGNVDLDIKTVYTFDNGYTTETKYPGGIASEADSSLAPGETFALAWGTGNIHAPLSQYLTPGTETKDLLGTVTVTIWAKGYDRNTGEELCESNKVSRTWRVAKPKNPQLTVTLEARDYNDIYASKTDFYEGETGFFYGEVENTGDVPLEIYDYDFTFTPGDTTLGREILGMRKLLNPGEKTAYMGDSYWFISTGATFDEYKVNLIKAVGEETETLIGTYTYSVKVYGYEPGTDNVLCAAENDCTMNLLQPKPAPELTLNWEFDGDSYTNPYDRDEFQPQEDVAAWHFVENTGNMDLKVGWHIEYGDGFSFTCKYPDQCFSLKAGEYWGTGFETNPISKHITPGTGTDTLLGTLEITFWYDGYDPDTGEKVCESNHITRVWKVLRAETGSSVLKGVSKHYEGVADMGGQKAPDEGHTAYSYVWAGMAGPLTPLVSSLYEDTGLTQPLTGDPVAGKEYRFFLNLRNSLGAGDHSIDLRQIDSALVDVTLAGFTVKYLGADVHDQTNGAPYDYVNLLFSAVCDDTPAPAKYVLRGVANHGLGVKDLAGQTAPDWGGKDPAYAWAGAAGSLVCYPSVLYLDPGTSQPLTGAPVAGTEYRFFLNLRNAFGPDNHAIDFTQIDPALVDVTLPGFTVKYLGCDVHDQSNGAPYDYVNLLFSATYEGNYATAKYVLKGMDAYWVGVKDSGGQTAPDWGSHVPGFIWADLPGYATYITSVLYLDPGTSQPLTGDPVMGETYRFFVNVRNGMGAGDHTIDFTQIDPSLVSGFMNGFTVKYLGCDVHDQSNGAPYDYVNLLFSATYDGGKETAKYVLKGVDAPYAGVKDAGGQMTLDWGANAPYYIWAGAAGSLNDVTSLLYIDKATTQPLTAAPQANETYYFFLNLRNAFGTGDHSIDLRQIDPALVSVSIPGFDVQYLGCDVHDQSNGAPYDYVNLLFSATFKSTVNPAISVYIWADPGAGDGKRVEGAIVPIHYEATNTGDCPVYVPWWPDSMSDAFDASAPNGHAEVADMWNLGEEALLYPGETYSQMQTHYVDAWEVEHGYLQETCWDLYWHYDANGNIADGYAYSNKLQVDLTGPDPEPAKPALIVTWKYDEIMDLDTSTGYNTMDPGLLEPNLTAWGHYDILNAGNVDLTVYTHIKHADGYVDPWDPYMLIDSLAPGKTEEDIWGESPLGDYIVPGTETDTLMGIASVTFWATGHDPVTGQELCRSNEITRTWRVAKDSTPVPEPGQSELQIWVARGSYDEQAYAEGHQLGEYWDTAFYVQNTGKVAVTDYTLHVDVTASDCDSLFWGDLDATDGAAWYEAKIKGTLSVNEVDDQHYWGACGTVAAGDVGRGYILVSAYVTWIDPDTGAERIAYSNILNLPVISRTGLLLKKSYQAPANGSYFQVDELIHWTLTVKNTSNEPIRNVVVTDNGVVVGAFAELAPGQEEPCAVPACKVTDYDANVVTCVTNQAFAEGDDLQGGRHSYPSNIVSAPCNEIVIPPPPPPPEKKDKDDPPEEPKIESKPGESCQLSLTAVGDAEIHYALHVCDEHLAAAKAAEAAGASAEGLRTAAGIWRTEINKLYKELCDAAKGDAKDAVLADQAAFWAYADAFEAMTAGQPGAPKALADMLRLYCAELCCMKRSAPDALPDSLLGDYASLMNGLAADAAGRTFTRLNGKDCEVTVKLDADLAAAMGAALSTVRGSKSDYAETAFVTAQAQWQMSLDSAINTAYRAADRDGRKLIAAWRKSLDQLIAARRELLSALYDGHGEIIEECIMNLYRDAAINNALAK